MGRVSSHVKLYISVMQIACLTLALCWFHALTYWHSVLFTYKWWLTPDLGHRGAITDGGGGTNSQSSLQIPLTSWKRFQLIPSYQESIYLYAHLLTCACKLVSLELSIKNPFSAIFYIVYSNSRNRFWIFLFLSIADPRPLKQPAGCSHPLPLLIFAAINVTKSESFPPTE